MSKVSYEFDVLQPGTRVIVVREPDELPGICHNQNDCNCNQAIGTIICRDEGDNWNKDHPYISFDKGNSCTGVPYWALKVINLPEPNTTWTNFKEAIRAVVCDEENAEDIINYIDELRDKI